jgi:hypothetical protein
MTKMKRRIMERMKRMILMKNLKKIKDSIKKITKMTRKSITLIDIFKGMKTKLIIYHHNI